MSSVMMVLKTRGVRLTQVDSHTEETNLTVTQWKIVGPHLHFVVSKRRSLFVHSFSVENMLDNK